MRISRELAASPFAPTAISLYLVLFTGPRPYYSSRGHLLFIFAHQNPFLLKSFWLSRLNFTTTLLWQTIVNHLSTQGSTKLAER